MLNHCITPVVWLLFGASFAFGHGLKIGAIDTNGDQDPDKLHFPNRADYDGSAGQNVQTTSYFPTTSSVMPGTFANALGFDAISVGTEGAAVKNNDVAAFVQIEVISILGPEEGRFGLIRDFVQSSDLTIDLPVGFGFPNQPNTSQETVFDISEGTPGDPSGDLTANGLFFNLPGNYQIVVRAIDRNGVFTPSEEITLVFITSDETPLDSLEMDLSLPTVKLLFSGQAQTDYFITKSTDLKTWLPVGDPFTPWSYAIQGGNGNLTVDTSVNSLVSTFFRYTAGKP